ncbi:MAG: CoA pyrophosphatase [Rhodospirillaceae bacterium]|nr:CoA pyrophosphatase [Rhodospirillaceae bacterium]
MALMNEGKLEPHDFAAYGQVPSTGIPYAQGAGAPGVKIKRKPAAVLVPLIETAHGFSVLLTKRTPDLKEHSGQIAFPGGRMEPTDESAAACALRETEEETGLPRSVVEVLGALDPYLTITGYEVTPVVGAVTPPFTLKPDPVEVAETFEVPLDFLMNPANHHRVEREYKGLTRAYYAMPYGQKYIWGATAGMILNLFEVLAAAP